MNKSLKLGAGLLATAGSGAIGFSVGGFIGLNKTLNNELEELKVEAGIRNLDLEACHEVVGSQAAELHDRLNQAAFEKTCSREQVASLQGELERKGAIAAGQDGKIEFLLDYIEDREIAETLCSKAHGEGIRNQVENIRKEKEKIIETFL
ncbi:MAG: hypothetical protein AAB802_01855, partial [Patescibacteria group bacterium]